MIAANQEILLENSSVSLFVKREDLLHEFISGNKFRKLKYNLLEAQKEHQHTILTFGGAYSNHIAAVAYAGKVNKMKTIGVIRGDEFVHKVEENPTLKFALNNGMQLEYISRTAYKNKDDLDFLENLKSKYGVFYHLPEGGTNERAVKGCEEILTSDDTIFDYICCSIGTGGTIAGLINSAFSHQKIIGFPALKGISFKDEICKFAKKSDWIENNEYTFGGYGKVSHELVSFINDFNAKHKIPLDPVYTGKMAYGIVDLISKNYFPKNSKILMIHSGGLQGIKGMNIKLAKKNLPIININD